MSTRSMLGLIYMVQGLQQLGADPTPVLARHGLSSTHLDPAARIERDRELRIYTDLAEHLEDPLIGLKLGSCYGLAGYGPLVMLLMTCATVYDALLAGVQYQELTYLFGTLRFEPGAQQSAMVLTPKPMGERVFRFRVDGEVAGTYKLIRDMQMSMGLNLHAERIELPYPRPPEAAAYQTHLGCPVQFGASEARFWLRNDYLKLKVPSADANAHAMYRAMCDQQLHAQRTATTTRLSERVRTHLGLFQGQYPSLDEVAKALDLSERTLRRQLSEEGHSFRDLLAETRYDKAQYLLRHTQLSVEAIAQQLGYAEAAAFIHAFQRWAGISPSAFRSQ